MLRKIILVFLILFLFINTSYGTKYAGEFLNLGVGGRALGLGSAYVAISDDATAVYWNPAGISKLPSQELVFMHAETFGSLLNHDFLSWVMPLQNRLQNYAFGVSLMRLGGGDIKVTELPDPNSPISSSNRPYIKKEAGHADYLLTFSFAKEKSNKLSFGGNAKLIYRHIVDNSAFGLGIDLGLLYTPTGYLSIGANLKDAVSTLLSYDNGSKETIAPSLRSGFALNKGYRDFNFLFVTEAEFNFEGRKYAAQYWQGDISLDMHYGWEAEYLERIAARIGFDRGDFSAGGGLNFKKFSLDLAFLHHEELDNSYRVSLRVKL
ncbi:MAG: PorV/PorQ family protein [candidate division Zixibacteria bacterium]|nr:PorV/PorQ family protein [candidate division Zixibacteria bacterium]